MKTKKRTEIEISASPKKSNLEKKILTVAAFFVFVLTGALLWYVNFGISSVAINSVLKQAVQSKVSDAISHADLRVFRKLNPAPRAKKPKREVQKLGRDIFVAEKKLEGISVFGEAPESEDLGRPFLALEMPTNEFESRF